MTACGSGSARVIAYFAVAIKFIEVYLSMGLSLFTNNTGHHNENNHFVEIDAFRLYYYFDIKCPVHMS